MTRILSYNILVGAADRVDQLTAIIKPVQSDIVGLVEATNPQVIEELADRLDMQPVMTGEGTHPGDWQIALLTRFPIVQTRTHIPLRAYLSPRQGTLSGGQISARVLHTIPKTASPLHSSRILTKQLLEVCIEEADGQQLTVFVTHLTAAFNRRRAGEHIRRQEMQAILDIMAAKRGTPHLLIGDFNTLAPGDQLKASNLLRYIVNLDKHHRNNPLKAFGHPDLNFVVPPYLRIFNPLLQIIPRSKILSGFFDGAAALYAPRGSIALLQRAGYVDCFRRLNPNSPGFTCPAEAPAGRIDFIFASPELVERLSACYVVTEGEDVQGAEASDHLAVFAEFGEGVEKQPRESSKNDSGEVVTM